MDIINDCVVLGHGAILGLKRRTVRKDENNVFPALIAPADPLDPNLDLGSDPREYMQLDVVKPTPDVDAQDIVLIVEDNQLIRVVKRIDNPTSPFVTYYAMKVTSVDS